MVVVATKSGNFRVPTWRVVAKSSRRSGSTGQHGSSNPAQRTEEERVRVFRLERRRGISAILTSTLGENGAKICSMGDALANQEEPRHGAGAEAKISRLRCDQIMEGFGILTARHADVVRHADEEAAVSEKVADANRKGARRIATSEYNAVVEDSMRKRRVAMHAAEKDHTDNVGAARVLKVKRLAEIEAQHVEALARARSEGMRVRSAIEKAGAQVRELEEEVLLRSPDTVSREDYRKGVHKEVNARMKVFYDEVSREEGSGLDETIMVSSTESTIDIMSSDEGSNRPDAESADTKMGEGATPDIRGGHLSGGGIVGVDGSESDGCGVDVQVVESEAPTPVPIPREWVALADGIGMVVEEGGEETGTE